MSDDNTLTFAIGDIHGQHAKLVALLAQCNQRAKGAAAHFVFLGDYIDRGPDSRAVIEALVAFKAEAPHRVTCLRGNHEALVLGIVAGDLAVMPSWLNKNGGGATLSSYGVANPAALLRRTWRGFPPCRFITTTAGVFSCTPVLTLIGRSVRNRNAICSGSGNRFSPAPATMDD